MRRCARSQVSFSLTVRAPWLLSWSVHQVWVFSGLEPTSRCDQGWDEDRALLGGCSWRSTLGSPAAVAAAAAATAVALAGAWRDLLFFLPFSVLLMVRF